MTKGGKGDTLVVQDLSTNGTFISNEKIGKNKSQEAKSGDKIYLLPSSAATAPNVIGFEFILGDNFPPTHSNHKTDNVSETNKTSLAPSTLSKNTGNIEESKSHDPPGNAVDVGVEELGEEMMCCICLDIIYQCVTAIPCLHNFCGGCFSDWMKKSTNCRIFTPKDF